jgi:hypothetical protein
VSEEEREEGMIGGRIMVVLAKDEDEDGRGTTGDLKMPLDNG